MVRKGKPKYEASVSLFRNYITAKPGALVGMASVTNYETGMVYSGVKLHKDGRDSIRVQMAENEARAVIQKVADKEVDRRIIRGY